ncbi:MAG TPA: glycoside hydrolase 100 family protein [Candidatus Pacearchaeota archaeon]|nr:glycoside hydrolase 100 family protein [Candidatus Pacearchaeota archaeon]
MINKKESSVELAYKKALDVIDKCSTKHGLYASAGKKAYRGVWSRDSNITLIGASFSSKNQEKIKEVFKRSLMTLAENQSKLGQIPNAVYGFNRKKIKVDFQSIDSSLWFILGEYYYKRKYGNELFNKHKKNIKKALVWLSYQDMEEDTLLEQLPTTDWQDAFPHKYGHTINTQALYYQVLSFADEKRKQKQLKFNVDDKKDKKLWSGDFYYSYRWKNHNKYKEIGEWFDSLGNLLAIVFGLADEKKSQKIISYIESHNVNKPYPIRAIYPTIKKGSKYWEDYYLDCRAGIPHEYLNGGIWPYIGGFYVLALIKVKKFKEAEEELMKLAEANIKGNYPEWINPLNKKMYGKYQAWSAGMYIWAYESLKKRKVLI